MHEAYIRLVDVERANHWDSRGHFFRAAAEAMRRILIESARRKTSLKRGGSVQRVDLDPNDFATADTSERVIALDEALTRLADEDCEKADLVKLRYFGGLSIQDAAAALGISTATADRHWVYARAWLQAEISSDGES